MLQIRQEDLGMSKKLNFLVIDDCNVVRAGIVEMIESSLENVGIVADIMESEDAENGLADLCAYSDELDVVFLAWNLPDVNGARVLSLIRENEDFDHIKVIATASEKHKKEVKSVKHLGLYGYLIKPFKQEDIDKMLRQVKDRVEDK
jgi:DNA-binding NarL/FixJ family response regulator